MSSSRTFHSGVRSHVFWSEVSLPNAQKDDIKCFFTLVSSFGKCIGTILSWHVFAQLVRLLYNHFA